MFAQTFNRFARRIRSNKCKNRNLRSKHRKTRRLALETLDTRRVFAVVMGDFNFDGYDDMATGIPHEKVAGSIDAGAVSVIYGGSTGLKSAGDQFWHQDSPGVPGGTESGDQFGASLAVGDFNGDKFDDLAVGVPGEDIGSIVRAGAVQILYGSAMGLVVSSFLVHQDSASMKEIAEEYDQFGEALTSGDYDGDGFDDLAIGVPHENVAVSTGVIEEDAGVVQFLYGSDDGITVSRNQIVQAGANGIADSPERYDFFGASLASGLISDDNFEDLVIGAPGEDIEGTSRQDKGLFDVGAVLVLLGQSNVASMPLNTYFTQDSDQIPGVNEAWDHFGAAVAVGDFDGDNYDDVAIGAPGDDVPSAHDGGAVTVMYGFNTDIPFNLSRTQLWTKEWASNLGFNTPEGYFGESLAAGDLNGDGRDDLAIGVPGHNDGRGSINVMYGQNNGLSKYQGQSYFQGSNGIQGSFEANDWFGAALAAGDTNGDGYDDVAIAVPGENVDPMINAGIVQVVPGRAAYGLDTAKDVIWHQDSSGIEDSNELDDYFGGTRPESFFSSVPVYQSKPGAPINLYLDFNGGVFGDNFGSAYTPEFSLDDRDGLNRTERAMIQDIWSVVAEDFAPFNINITTVYPSSGAVYRVVIGGDGSERLSNPTSGVSPDPVWGDSNVYVFSDLIQSWYIVGDDLALRIGTTASHEAGHRFGLAHKSTYYPGGSIEYSSGGTTWTPIMGDNLNLDRTIWAQSLIQIDGYPHTIQGSDDFGTLEAVLGLRKDDNFGDGMVWLPAAENLGSPTAGMLTQQGLIRHTSDEDTYRFELTGSSEVDISLKVNDVGANLDSTLRLRSIYGNVIASSQASNSLDATIHYKLSAGSFFVTVGSQGEFDGDVGRYTLRIEQTKDTTALTPIVKDSLPKLPIIIGESGGGVSPDHDHQDLDAIAHVAIGEQTHHANWRSDDVTSNRLHMRPESKQLKSTDNVFAVWPDDAPHRQLQHFDYTLSLQTERAKKWSAGEDLLDWSDVDWLES